MDTTGLRFAGSSGIGRLQHQGTHLSRGVYEILQRRAHPRIRVQAFFPNIPSPGIGGSSGTCEYQHKTRVIPAFLSGATFVC